MKITFSLLDWHAGAPGLGDGSAWRSWAEQPGGAIDAQAPLAKCTQLPMMTARRLYSGSRTAVDCGLTLLRRHRVDAIVFTSRHGELERNLNILQALSRNETPSPTDFTMSVHNAAAGSLTIAAQAPLVTASLSAGADSFQQGLIEVAALHAADYAQVLLVDFDGPIPAFFNDVIPAQMPRYPYAVALLLAKGDGLTCESLPAEPGTEPGLPQSLQFLRALLAAEPAFHIQGDRLSWHWTHRVG